MRELYLSYNQIKKIEGLENLKNLKILDLDDNKISEIEGLEHLTNLEELTFRYNNFPFNKLSRKEISPFFTELKNLKRLNFKKFPETDSYYIGYGKF